MISWKHVNIKDQDQELNPEERHSPTHLLNIGVFFFSYTLPPGDQVYDFKCSS